MSYLTEIKKIPILEEEAKKELIIKAQNGCKDSRNKLIEHHLHIAFKVAVSQRNLFKEPIDDLINIGSFGLIQAIDDYKFNKEASFDTFARLCIKRELVDYYNRRKRQKRDNSKDISINKPIFFRKMVNQFCLKKELLKNY